MINIAFIRCEFVSGWVSGVLGIITGHPLDTIKVRMQISPDSSFVSNVKTTYKVEGVRGFYKGLSFPILSAGVLNALFFGVYGNALRNMIGGSYQTYCCEVVPRKEELWHSKVCLAGFLGGITSSIVGCPVDCIKTKLQGSKEMKLGAWSVAKNILLNKGVRGMYCGFFPMVCRDGPGFAVYILSYEHALCVLEGQLSLGGEPRVLSEIISGGVAGCLSWVIVMPFDVVKSRIQWDDSSRPKYLGMLDCFRKSWTTEGPRIFFKGIGVAVLRSFPVNSVTFVTYQFCMRQCHLKSTL